MALSRAQIEETAGFADIKVDLKSLRDFANLLRQELEQNLDPAWSKLGGKTLLEDKAQFGKSAELDLDGTAGEYDAYLQEARLLLSNLIEGTRVIAEGADRIAANYGGADQFAAIQADKVHEYLPAIGSRSTSVDDF